MALITRKNHTYSDAIASGTAAFILTATIIAGFAAFAAAQTPADSLRNLSPQAIFDKANIQIELHHYDRALALYQAIENEHVDSGPLYLNMGIAYSRQDSLGLAKYYFMKAAGFSSTHTRALDGIDFVNNRLTHNETLLPALPWDRFFNWIRTQIGIHALVFISLLIINLGVVAYIASWLWPAYKKWLEKPGLGILILGILLLILGGFTDYQARRYTPAIQIVKESNVREKPAAKAGVVSLAYEGYRFQIDHKRSKNHPGWYYVRMGNGQYGWIHRDDLKLF